MAAKKLTKRGPTKVAKLPPEKPAVGSPKLYTVKVSLSHGRFSTKGRVPRTIQVLGTHTLENLHYAIFDAYDREEEHLWVFLIGGKDFRDPANREFGPPELRDAEVQSARKATIDGLRLKVGQSFGYRFDFGDNWEHVIQVEAVGPSFVSEMSPLVLKKKGQSPPQYPDEE